MPDSERQPNRPPAEAMTLSERAALLVEQDILAGHLAPGSRLGIVDLVQRYEIGATPLREGLSRLMSRGLIVGIGQRGFRVADISRADLLDITTMRTAVEVEAISRPPARRPSQRAQGSGVLVFGEEDDELEHAVVRLLNERGRSMAVAEWATDGLVSEWLAEATASSECFRTGIVMHGPAALGSLLQIVPASDVSAPETASAMARAIQQRMGTDYGLGIAAFPTHATAAPTATAATPTPTNWC